MTEQTRGWRALPALFGMALIGQGLLAAMYAMWMVVGESDKWFARMALGSSGAHLAVSALAAAGAYELARRHAGRVRTLLHVAAVGFAGSVVVTIAWDWVFTLWQPTSEGSFETVNKVLSYASFGVDLIVALALAGAAWSRRGPAIAGVVLAIAGAPPPPVHRWLIEAFSGSKHQFQIAETLLQLLFCAGLTVLALAAASTPATTDARRATSGLRQIGTALRLRVAAVLVGTGLIALLMMGSSGGEGALDIVKLATMSAAVLNVVAQIIMSLGAMSAASAEFADLPRWPLAVASALSLWVTGVLLAQLPQIYQMLYGHGHEMFGKELGDTLSLAVPFAVTASAGIVAVTIGTLASRRGDAALHHHVSGKGVGFVILMLSSLAITAWVVPEAKSLQGLAVMMMCAVGAAMWAMLMMAKLCNLGADTIESEPGLPSAKLVS